MRIHACTKALAGRPNSYIRAFVRRRRIHARTKSLAGRRNSYIRAFVYRRRIHSRTKALARSPNSYINWLSDNQNKSILQMEKFEFHSNLNL